MEFRQVKITVTVPTAHVEVVRQAAGEAGGGRIGKYSFCSFSMTGTGRFQPEEGAQPAIGTIGALEEVSEDRIEITCESQHAAVVVEAIRRVHPYEEPAIDLYPLLDIHQLPSS